MYIYTYIIYVYYTCIIYVFQIDNSSNRNSAAIFDFY